MGKAEVEIVDEIYKTGRERAEAELAEIKSVQADREKRIAQAHQFIGRIQAAKMFTKFGNVSELMWIKDVKESELYRYLPGVETWEKFCNTLGYTSRHINEQLNNLQAFGADFMETVSDLRVGYRDLRKLRQLTHDGTICIADNLVKIGDESIPLDPDHRDDLQAALEQVVDAKNQVISEKDLTIKTKDRLLADKQKLIERQEKDLARYEVEAEKKGLTAEENKVIQECRNACTIIDGFLSKFDPERNPLPNNPTPRMKAALMETLGYFKRVVIASFDTAADLYGDPELDDDWIPPHLRDGDNDKE